MDCERWKVKFCKNDARKGRKLCCACESRKRRDLHPVRQAYFTLREHAKARHIPFGLTYDYWQRWCSRHGYIQKRGRGSDDLTVDRIIPALGYVNGNIQPLTNANNVRKRFKDAKEKYKHIKIERDPACPF